MNTNCLHRRPAVFIHGLFGWGEGDGLEKNYHYWGFGGRERDLLGYLRRCRFEVFAPSLGPVTGAWDRSCELWAYLKGGRVDYGKVHSETFGHARFGRAYPGVLKDWGTPGAHEKIDLIAHSFGGMNALVFSELILHGSREEREGTPEDELSDLFRENKKEKIRSVTTVSGVINGTTFADSLGEKGMKTVVSAVFGVSALIGWSPLMKLYDMYLDPWDVTSAPGKPLRDRLIPPTKALRGIREYNAHRLDNVGFEMQLATAHEINSHIDTDPEVYYFARRACRTHDDGKGRQVPNRDMRKILKVWSTIIGRYRPERLKEYGFDDSWLPSDGIVNVRGHSSPVSAPAADGTGVSEFRPGVWYNMPVEDKHHMSWVGIGEDPKAFFGYYREMLEALQKLE
ncbi:MAG: hypothetical protein J5585_00190 [Clostridia bacterium]|nr:hypothetical protein [Clostridia bacterium]